MVTYFSNDHYTVNYPVKCIFNADSFEFSLLTSTSLIVCNHTICIIVVEGTVTDITSHSSTTSAPTTSPSTEPATQPTNSTTTSYSPTTTTRPTPIF